MDRAVRLLEDGSTEEFVAAVNQMTEAEILEATASLPLADGLTQLMPGKMLRTRLAARMVACGASGADRWTLERSCAAIELVHTASLCHDDVIDNSFLRRARPTLWRRQSASVAILVGDLLFCKAMEILAGTPRGRYMSAFVSKVREVCATEAEHEISFRGGRLARSTCLRLARGKTGPLFAFVGLVSGGDEKDLSAAVEEAGYRIGTAYQIFDDLVDIVGDEREAKKTLGTDAVRRKFTIPQSPEDGQGTAIDCVGSLCRSAVECVSGWPRARTGIEMYLEHDLGPVFDRHLGYLDASPVRSTTLTSASSVEPSGRRGTEPAV